MMFVAGELICFVLLKEPSPGCAGSLQSTYCKSFESLPGFRKPLNYPTPESLTEKKKLFWFSGPRIGGKALGHGQRIYQQGTCVGFYYSGSQIFVFLSCKKKDWIGQMRRCPFHQTLQLRGKGNVRSTFNFKNSAGMREFSLIRGHLILQVYTSRSQ